MSENLNDFVEINNDHNNSDDTDQKDQHDQTAKSAFPENKSKRGRPKKQRLQEITNDDLTEKKPGRPRKHILEDQQPKPPRVFKWKNDPIAYTRAYYREKVKCNLVCDICEKNFCL